MSGSKKLCIVLILLNIVTALLFVKNTRELMLINRSVESGIMHGIEKISRETEQLGKNEQGMDIRYTLSEVSALLTQLDTYSMLNKRAQCDDFIMLMQRLRYELNNGYDPSDKKAEALITINKYIEAFQQCDGKNLSDKFNNFAEMANNDEEFFNLRHW